MLASYIVGGFVSQSVAKETSTIIGRVSVIGELVSWFVGWLVGWLVGGGDALLVGVLSEGGSSPDPISTSLETRCCYLAAQRDPIKSPMSISATTQCVILFVTGQLFL